MESARSKKKDCSGIAPGHGSPTGFPVRSHHLCGLAADSGSGELHHLNEYFK
jgi:hypothetical protein